MWLHFARTDPRRFVSAADVLAGKADPDRFERKLVLIGVTALGPVRLPGDAGDRSDVGRGDPRPAPRMHLRRRSAVPPARWPRGPKPPLLLAGRSPDSSSWCRGSRSGRRSRLLALLIGLAWTRRAPRLSPSRAPVRRRAPVARPRPCSSRRCSWSRWRRPRRQRRDPAPRGRAAARGGGRAARRRAGGGAPHPDGQPSAGHRRSFRATRASISTRSSSPPARWAAISTTSSRSIDDRVFFLIGDVSGKGVPGSLFMAVSKALYKSTALRQARAGRRR